jgi:hypothetical protein
MMAQVTFDIPQDAFARQLHTMTMKMAQFAYREEQQDGKFVGVIDFHDESAAEHFRVNVLPHVPK